jgi:hypothetical protein
MATYPFFQKAISDSTPFSGTMADTSTPTPEGMATQTPQAPVATEAPGEAGNRERLRKIQADRGLIQQQLEFVAKARTTRTNPWSLAIHMALEGHIGKESAGETYHRYAIMNDLLKNDAQLAEEERLLTTPNPAVQKTGDEAADRQRRAADMNFLDRFNRERGLPQVPQEIQIQYIEKGYSLNEAAAKAGKGGDDEIKGLISAANAGQEVGPEGVSALGLTGRMGDVAAAGAKHAEKVRQEEAERKAKEDSGALPVLGLFKKPSDLFAAMNTDLRTTLDDEMYYTIVKTETLDPMGKPMERKTRNAAQLKAARADVASRWPGYEKYFPNFVEKGFTDVPVVDPAQGDVDVNKIRKELTKPKATEKK